MKKTKQIKKLTHLASLVLTTGLLLNCKNTDFSQNSANPSNQEQNNEQKNKCENDQYFDNQTNSCLDFECKEYVELTGSHLNIPKRDFIKGTCYYSKAISAPANLIQERTALQILSRNHDNYAENIAPKQIGLARYTLKLNDFRAIKLVGNEKNSQSKIHVDNYIFVRMNQESSLNAYGTRDSSYLTGFETELYSDIIKYNNKNIPLTYFEEGGAAYVDPIDITSTYPVGIATDLNLDALDCGGGQYLEDIYMLIQ